MKVVWKVSRLAKILLWNVTKWGLSFNIDPLQFTHLFHWFCSALIPLVTKVINSRYDVSLWTFQPTFVCIYIYIYTPRDKNIRPLSKMNKKILFSIFKLWKLDIWKIRNKDNKLKIWRNFNSFLICILAFMLNFKILFWHKYKTNEQNYRI